jgi:uroporphyrinogen III methyltransferase / synthase
VSVLNADEHSGSRPLRGWSVVVTRPSHQAGTLVAALERHGARALGVPTIAIVAPDDGGALLREALARVSEFAWVVLTSENAVDRLFDAVGDRRDLARVRFAAIGEETAEALSRCGVEADLVPGRYIAEALVEAFPPADGGGKVLLPRAAIARDVVPEGLRKLGWHVDVVEAYKTVPAEISSSSIARVRSADVITFTSSSTVSGFLQVAEIADLPPVVASIGPITSRTATDAGIEVSVEAEVHTCAGLADALAAFARANGRPDRHSARPS